MKDHLALKISIKQLRETAVLHEELSKFSLKRVFNPIDEAMLPPANTETQIQIGKRVFDPRDKNY